MSSAPSPLPALSSLLGYRHQKPFPVPSYTDSKYISTDLEIAKRKLLIEFADFPISTIKYRQKATYIVACSVRMDTIYYGIMYMIRRSGKVWTHYICYQEAVGKK